MTESINVNQFQCAAYIIERGKKGVAAPSQVYTAWQRYVIRYRVVGGKSCADDRMAVCLNTSRVLGNQHLDHSLGTGVLSAHCDSPGHLLSRGHFSCHVSKKYFVITPTYVAMSI